MPGSGVSQGAVGYAKDGVFGRYSFFIVWEWFAEQGSGDKTWACNLCGFELGFWIERDWGMGHVARLEFKAQMDLGTMVSYSYNMYRISHGIFMAMVKVVLV